jgi:hypothetical protein
LFSSLAALEARHRGGEVDEPRYSELRQDLVGALSRIYVELDKPLDTRISREAGQP